MSVARQIKYYTVYDFDHDKMVDYPLSDKVRVGIYEDMEIDFSQVVTG